MNLNVKVVFSLHSWSSWCWRGKCLCSWVGANGENCGITFDMSQRKGVHCPTSTLTLPPKKYLLPNPNFDMTKKDVNIQYELKANIKRAIGIYGHVMGNIWTSSPQFIEILFIKNWTGFYYYGQDERTSQRQLKNMHEPYKLTLTLLDVCGG